MSTKRGTGTCVTRRKSLLSGEKGWRGSA